MFDAAVEIALATFVSKSDWSLDEIQSFLETTGVDPWLTHRLVTYVPLAFSHKLLGDALGFMLPGGDPVFLAAQKRAARATAEEFRALGPHLDPDKVTTQAALRQDECSLPLPTGMRAHGGLPSPREAFRDFIIAHGHAVERGDRLSVGDLTFDARVFPRFGKSPSVQVDFEVIHPSLATRHLLESFAGAGATWHEALAQTISKFERGSLHPWMAGLLNRHSCADQVEWESLSHPSGAFELCLGAQLNLYSTNPNACMGPLLDELKVALARVPLEHKAHGLRVFTCWNGPECVGAEVLLDNQSWEEGEAIVTNHAWPPWEGYWAIRHFLMVVPSSLRE